VVRKACYTAAMRQLVGPILLIDGIDKQYFELLSKSNYFPVGRAEGLTLKGDKEAI